MAVVARRRAEALPRDYPENTRVHVLTIIDWVVRDFRQTLYTLFAAVALLLVIACCNVSNMLLARATTRQRELTVRAALGASRGRIIRQLLIESVTLAAGGTLVGIALAYAGIAALAGIMPRAGVAWEVELRIDRAVLLFALATAAFATFAFGLFPAFTAARRDLVSSINNAAGRTGSAGPKQRRLRGGLVVAEVALSVVLLLGAGLLMRTFLSLASVDLGFDTRNLLLVSFAFPSTDESPAVTHPFYLAVLERARTIPGVQSAAVGNGVPGGGRMPFEIPGVTFAEPPAAITQFCSEDYAGTLGLRLLAGRQLSRGDVVSARKVAVVNRTMAERYLGGRDPIGATIRFPRLASAPVPVADPSFEVIGIVQDVVNMGLTEPVQPQAYMPFSVAGRPYFLLIVRTAGEPMALFESIRGEIRRINPRVAVTAPTTLEEDLRRNAYARPRFNVVVLGIFAVTGLALVALGIYGVVSYTVSQETKQIAIRVALGGERRHVLGIVLRSGLLLVVIGLSVGVAAGLATNRLLQTVLWRVTPQDPLTIGATIALVITIAIAACSVPAWRALRVNPVVALRHE